MLAYVFWHVPRPGVAAREYEAAHRDFHDALWQTPVPGLMALRVYRLTAIPWIEHVPAGYEDWHLLEDSEALDELNVAAITQARQMPHDRIAALAASGTAGLYGLRSGAPIVPTHAYWMAKTSGMSYAAFDASLESHVAAGCCLWARRMTLGPTPEFCLHAPGERKPPHAALVASLRVVLSRDHTTAKPGA